MTLRLLGGALALVVMLGAAATAGADFTLSACGGSSVAGRGSSLMLRAHNTWAGGSWLAAPPTGCGASAPAVTYSPDGALAGLQALGARGTGNAMQARDDTVRFASGELPPDPTQRAQIEGGPVDGTGNPVTGADDGKLHVIPAASTAVAVLVNWPRDNVGVACDFAGLGMTGGRPQIPQTDIETAFAGEYATWGQLIAPQTFTDPQCASQPLKRIVRLDGGAGPLRQWLARVNPSRHWLGLASTEWPNNTGSLAVFRPTAAGAGALRNVMTGTAGGTSYRQDGSTSGSTSTLAGNGVPGSIGYADLSTARNPGAIDTQSSFTLDPTTPDTTFWLPIEAAPGSYVDPQSDATGYKMTADTSHYGANCADITPSNVPLDTLGDWSQTDATRTTGGYGICGLSYVMAFDDPATAYCNTAVEQARARTVKDYFTSILTDTAQTRATANDYSRLPASLLSTAQAGVAAMGWAKSGGRDCSTPTTDQPSVTQPITTPAARPALTKVAVKKRSVVFTVSQRAKVTLRISRVIKGRRVGKRCVPTAKRGKRCVKLVRVLTKSVTANGSGTIRFARNKLRRGTYRATLVAVSASGRSRPVTRTFVVAA